MQNLGKRFGVGDPRMSSPDQRQNPLPDTHPEQIPPQDPDPGKGKIEAPEGYGSCLDPEQLSLLDYC